VTQTAREDRYFVTCNYPVFERYTACQKGRSVRVVVSAPEHASVKCLALACLAYL
jgi:hypothetical protein